MIIRKIKLVAIILFMVQMANAQNYNQSVKDFAEGKYYKNNETGRSIKYGYISSLNTYGVTLKNNQGDLSYFMNCTEELSSDEQYMELTYCMSPNTGGTLGTIVVTKNKIVWKASDGSLTFYLENNNQTSNNYAKSESKNRSDSYKIGNIEVGKFDYSYENLTLKEWKDKIAKKNLGSNWRLPSKEELLLMYKNKSALNIHINEFDQEDSYIGIDNGKIIMISMYNGELDDPARRNKTYIHVRLVRIIKSNSPSPKPISKKPISK